MTMRLIVDKTSYGGDAMIAHINAETRAEQTVLSHLQGTAALSEKLACPLGMGNLAYLTGLLHDLGKWRKKFEDYIRTAIDHPEKVRKGEVNHSSAGAIYVYQRYYKGDKLQRLTAQLMAEAILSHHGLNDCLSPQGDEAFRTRIEKLEDLDYDEVLVNLEKSGIKAEELDDRFAKAQEEIAVFIRKTSGYDYGKSFFQGMIERMLLSILIDADRTDTAVFCGTREELAWEFTDWELLCRKMEGYLAQPKFMQDTHISRIRRDIADECLRFAENQTGIYRLSVPTGGGKTLSGLRLALNHIAGTRRESFGKIENSEIQKNLEKPENPAPTAKKRIFYIGPYLSILEQNAQVFRDVLGDGDFLLEHHSNVVQDDESQLEGSRYRQMTENWEVPIVLTTFVQFLNTLFSDSTQSVRRFHSLADSIIIIDEIQSLPIHMICMFNLMMNYLSAVWNVTVILCSATQPVLHHVKPPIDLGRPEDVIENTAKLYASLKRVRIEEKKGWLDTSQLSRFVADIAGRERSVLAILNTKAAVRALFLELKQYYADSSKPVRIVYLTTNMCPEHRLKVIHDLKQQLEAIQEGSTNERMICVSTSLIEAGVDLSFCSVIRSYAGMDNVAQAAGRCNRNGESEEGVVYLVRYKEENMSHQKQVVKGASCSEKLVEDFQQNPQRYDHDLLSPQALNTYYNHYYYDTEQQKLMRYPIEKKGFTLLDLLSENRVGKMAAYRDKRQVELELCQAFKTAGACFQAIDSDTVSILVPYEKGREYIADLCSFHSTPAECKKILRKAQRFTVNLYRYQFEKMKNLEALQFLEKAGAWALKEGFYDEEMGVVMEKRLDFMDI